MKRAQAKLEQLQRDLAALTRIILEADERRKDEIFIASEALLRCTTTTTQLRAALKADQDG